MNNNRLLCPNCKNPLHQFVKIKKIGKKEYNVFGLTCINCEFETRGYLKLGYAIRGFKQTNFLKKHAGIKVRVKKNSELLNAIGDL